MVCFDLLTFSSNCKFKGCIDSPAMLHSMFVYGSQVGIVALSASYPPTFTPLNNSNQITPSSGFRPKNIVRATNRAFCHLIEILCFRLPRIPEFEKMGLKSAFMPGYTEAPPAVTDDELKQIPKIFQAVSKP